MDPHKAQQQVNNRVIDGAPELEQTDWDDVGGEEARDVGVADDADLAEEVDPSGDLLEEDDDNAYQNSDEALPDDVEEAVINRNPSREGGLFDEA